MQHSLKKMLVKKQIKTRRLTNIYHSDDDDIGDGYNLLSPPLSVPLPLPKTGVSSHIVLIFLSTVFSLAVAIGYSQKRDFSNITVIIRVLCLARLRVFNIIADFMGCSMDLTVAGQRPSIQNSIVVLFPDIFMNFWLLSYRNLNRYVI